MLPEGAVSLRPVLRINTEIRDGRDIYVEFNTPVSYRDRRGWMNIENWDSSSEKIDLCREGKKVTIKTAFLTLSYEGIGIEGGCPAEKDNEGCFYLDGDMAFRKAETITEKKEFCDCEFSWHFGREGAHGRSQRKTLPAFEERSVVTYPKKELNAENAAAIECIQVLGTYIVRFDR